MARWVGAQGQVNSTTRAKTCPHYDITKENPTCKTKKTFFPFELQDLLNP